jgi:hypothetical protein
LAGTDVANRVYQVVALLLTIVAVTAAVLRVTMGRASRRGGRGTATSTPTAAGPTVAAPPAAPLPASRPLPPPSGAAVPLGDPLISRPRSSELVG